MKWNYGVIATPTADGTVYALHEFYHSDDLGAADETEGEDGGGLSWTAQPIRFEAETLDGLLAMLEDAAENVMRAKTGPDREEFFREEAVSDEVVTTMVVDPVAAPAEVAARGEVVGTFAVRLGDATETRYVAGLGEELGEQEEAGVVRLGSYPYGCEGDGHYFETDLVEGRYAVVKLD